MKSDSSSIGKAPTAGRPRDTRIDAAILAAAAQLVVEVGYANLSLAAVAERAGTTKTALYRRWSSKAELVHEAVFAVPPSAVAAPAGDAVDDAVGDIRAMVAGARDAFTNPAVRAALPGLIADMAGDATLTARVLDRFGALFDALRLWVAGGIDRGAVRADLDADRLLELIGGAALFALMLRPGAELDDDWVGRIAGVLVHGVVP